MLRILRSACSVGIIPDESMAWRAFDTHTPTDHDKIKTKLAAMKPVARRQGRQRSSSNLHTPLGNSHLKGGGGDFSSRAEKKWSQAGPANVEQKGILRFSRTGIRPKQPLVGSVHLWIPSRCLDHTRTLSHLLDPHTTHLR